MIGHIPFYFVVDDAACARHARSGAAPARWTGRGSVRYLSLRAANRSLVDFIPAKSVLTACCAFFITSGCPPATLCLSDGSCSTFVTNGGLCLTGFAFGGSPEVWLRMQMNYDLAQALKNADKIHVERLSAA
jgi:hypothetical protein